MASMTKVQSFLMFEGRAEPAMRFYVFLDRYGVSWRHNLS